jgi:hypothetical protein
MKKACSWLFEFRQFVAVRGILVSLGIPCWTAQGQVMTNFPPSDRVPEIRLQIERSDAGRIKLQWNAVPLEPASYVLMSRTNLADGEWKPASDWIHADSETASVQIEPRNANFAVYRVVSSGVIDALRVQYYLNLLTYDGGDYDFIARRDAAGNIVAYDQENHFRRVFRLVHVRFNADMGTNFVTASGYTLEPVTVHMGPAMELWRIVEEPVYVGRDMVAWGRVQTLERVLADLRADERVVFAYPTFNGPAVADTQLTVALKDGVDISELSEFLAEQGVSPGGRIEPPNYYRAYLTYPKTQDPFVLSRSLTRDSRVVWAAPNSLADWSLDNHLWDYLLNVSTR